MELPEEQYHLSFSDIVIAINDLLMTEYEQLKADNLSPLRPTYNQALRDCVGEADKIALLQDAVADWIRTGKRIRLPRQSHE